MSSLHLRRASGPDLEISRERSLIGREQGCDVVIEDRSVSRRHAVIEHRGGDWVLVDQGSANGTFLDGRRVSEARLANGQELRVGTVAFQVQLEEEVAATVMMAAPPDLEGATMMMTPADGPAPTVAPPPARTVAPAAAPPSPSAAPAPPRPRQVARPPEPSPPPAAAGPDPFEVLGLPRAASPEEVQARFEERSQELQIKLAGASSLELKSTYERQLLDLNRAYRKLSRGPEPLADIADLPSAQPVVAADLLDGEGYRRGRKEEPVGEAAEAKGADAILPASTSVLVFLGTGLLALFAFFGLSSSKIDKNVHKEEESPILINARQGAAKYGGTEVLLKDRALHNGTLRLCSRASRPLEVKRLTAIFARPAEDTPAEADPELMKLVSGLKLGSYNSAYCVHGDFKLTLSPGAETAVAFKSDEPRCNFDGKAIFYAFAVQPPPGVAAAEGVGHAAAAVGEEREPVWVAGLLNEKDACVAVGEGW
ncbi:MAG TPA: FHA domain-containing protein [Vicinamibacteria bacterium]|nr:FHA domain-containing protein [Vicinamibacteria bacterium]